MAQSLPAETVYQVREHAVGGVLDQTLYLFRDNFRLILLCYLVFSMPFDLLITVVSFVFGFGAAAREAGGVPFFTTQFDLLNLIHLPIFFFVSQPLMNAAVIYGVGMSYLGQAPPFRECAWAALRNWLTIIVILLLTWIVTTIGTLLCVIPGILAMLILLIATPVAVLERTDPITALVRSARLMRGFMLPAFVLTFVVNLAHLPVTILIGSIPQFETSITLINVFGSFYPVIHTIMITVLYTTARCRTESLDLEIMTREVEASGLTEAPAL